MNSVCSAPSFMTMRLNSSTSCLVNAILSRFQIPFVCLEVCKRIDKHRSPCFQWVPSVLLLKLGKICVQIMLPHFRILRTNSAEFTSAIHSTCGVVHWPILCTGVVLSHLEHRFEIAKPLVDELIAGVNGSADKAIGGFQEDLRGFDNHSAHWRVEDDLASEGIQGYLVIRAEPGEVIISWRGLGCFVV